MKLSVFFACLIFLATGVSAQKKTVTAEAEFNGLEQPASIKLPLPEYPEIAKKSGLAGQISVAVILDKNGSVASADDPQGPYPMCSSAKEPSVVSLRNAALTAARKAKFKIAPSITEPLKGRITYSFANGDSDQNGKSSYNSSSGEMRLDRITKLGSTDSDMGARVVDPNDTDTVSKNSSGQANSNPKTVSGGVLNQKALQLTKPSYPPAAKAVKAGGPVAVQVIINEDGEIYMAAAVSGHPLLRRSSEIAACSSRFSPTLLSGQPVKVAGVITYNFVP